MHGDPFRQAVASHQAGELGEARRLYRKVLRSKPDHVPALNLLGTLELQLGDYAAAELVIRRAVKIAPQSESTHYNLGIALQGLRRLDEALECYDQALAINNNAADIWNTRGSALKELKRFDEAIASFNRALTIKPNYVAALYNCANSYQALDRCEQALAMFDKALTIDPRFAEALSNRGLVLQKLNRNEEALSSYDRALEIQPQFVEALCNRGVVLQRLRRMDEALASYERALAFNSDHVEALCLRANALRMFGRFEESLADYERVLACKADHIEALNGRGHLLFRLSRFGDALSCFDKALSAKPTDPDSLSNRGIALQGLRRDAEAMASFGQALVIDANHANAHWNEALLRLALGDYRLGWVKHEWRWKKEDNIPRSFSQPLWLRDKPIRGKTVLLHAEQGLGDTLQFVRYVPLVARTGNRVVLEVQPPLKRLLSQIEGADAVISVGEPLPPFDYHCPLLSLPLAFKTEIATIPASLPYLKANPQIVTSQQYRFPDCPRLRVGLAWSGNPKQLSNRRRSIAIDRLAPLLSLTGIRFVSLQKEARTEDANVLQGFPYFTHIGPTLGDFAEVAGLMAHLDLIVTVDTSFAHLAGALGKPVWILLSYAPDWRWMYEREDSPWYPTARLFRQPTIGDWDSVVERLRQELTIAAEQKFAWAITADK